MHKRFINQTAITGYASIAFAFIPFVQGGATLNLMTWILGGVGIILVLYGAIFTPNKCPTFSELTALVEKRKQYLPRLKEITETKINKHDEIRDKASKASFEEYGRKYFAGNRKYRESLKKDPGNINFAIQTGLFSADFISNNLLYQDLLKLEMGNIESQYNILYTQIADRRLKKLLKNYWDIEKKGNSEWIFGELMKTGKQNINIPKRHLLNGGTEAIIWIKNREFSNPSLPFVTR